MAVSYWVTYGFGYVDSGAQWRFPIALQIFFALSTIILISFLPETPRWLLNHDRSDEAIQVLQRLHENEGLEVVERERLEIVTAIVDERLAQERLGQKRYLLFFYHIGIPSLTESVLFGWYFLMESNGYSTALCLELEPWLCSN